MPRKRQPVKAPALRKPRKSFKGTQQMSYLWEGIPRELIEKAHTKCRRQIPPVTLKWKLYELLHAWVYPKADSVIQPLPPANAKELF